MNKRTEEYYSADEIQKAAHILTLFLDRLDKDWDRVARHHGYTIAKMMLIKADKMKRPIMPSIKEV